MVVVTGMGFLYFIIHLFEIDLFVFELGRKKSSHLLGLERDHMSLRLFGFSK